MVNPDDGVYIVKDGMTYKITPKVEVPFEKRVNVITGEVYYPSTADRIRSMTDKELATWLNCMQSNAYHCGEFGRTNAAYPFNYKAWLDWLKSPVEEET